MTEYTNNLSYLFIIKSIFQIRTKSPFHKLRIPSGTFYAVFFLFLDKNASLSKIGVIIVVTTTTITTGPKRSSEISPLAAPLLATIRATSPLEIIPTPICKLSLGEYLQSNAPNPQPITLVNIAIIPRITVNIIKVAVISFNSTLKPMLAKNNGDKYKYDNTEKRVSIKDVL